MEINDLRGLYLSELQEARSMEEQITRAMPSMIDAASDPGLKESLDHHLSETRTQLERLSTLLERHGADPREHKDQSMQTIIAESEKWIGSIDNSATRDAALIASVQRIEHYEMAVYGSLAAWAKQQRLDDLDVLVSILDEEKSADVTLSDHAKRSVNVDAAA